MELLAGDRLGKYEVIGRLAAGGMAEVYLAKILGHGGFAKPVALKRMLPSLACEPGFREMFMQEAALAAQLNHPHVVQIFDFAEERGELYLAMEYVHGVNLRRLHANVLSARAKGASSLKLPPMLAAHIARCVARALGYAWTVPDERGQQLHLIHRDVSPHNVLLSFQGDVKLADFGIAKPAGMHTSVGTLKGKLLYMSPEQLLGGPLDARTDVFALGIVLYETALGLAHPLFQAGSQGAVQQALKERKVVPPVRMDPDFPPALSDAIMKALERDPEKRFQTASEFAEALGEALHHEAKSPQEYDLAAFAKRLYGEPPPIRGLFSSGSAIERGAKELERVANDSSAATLPRARLSELQALEPSITSKSPDHVAPHVVEALAVEPAPPKPCDPGPQPLPPAPPDPAQDLGRNKSRTTVLDRLLPSAREVEQAIRAIADEPSPGPRAIAPSPPLVPMPAEQLLVAPVARSAAAVGGPRRPASATGRTVPGWLKGVIGAGLGMVIAAGVIAWRRPASTLPASTSSEERKVSLPPAVVPATPIASPTPTEPVLAATEAPSPIEEKEKGGPKSVMAAPAEPAMVIPAPPSPERPKERSVTPTPASRPPVSSAASPRPRRAEKRGIGTLILHIKPWAHVWLDSEPFKGTEDQEAAPRLVRQVVSGRHVVHIRDGLGREKTVDVAVLADQEVKVEGFFEEIVGR